MENSFGLPLKGDSNFFIKIDPLYERVGLQLVEKQYFNEVLNLFFYIYFLCMRDYTVE